MPQPDNRNYFSRTPGTCQAEVNTENTEHAEHPEQSEHTGHTGHTKNTQHTKDTEGQEPLSIIYEGLAKMRDILRKDTWNTLRQEYFNGDFFDLRKRELGPTLQKVLHLFLVLYFANNNSV